MPDFDSFDDLAKYLKTSIVNSVKKEVGNEAKKVLKEKVITEVYDKSKYEPDTYNRKYYRGGLLDDKNIEVKVEDNTDKKITISIRSTRTNDSDDGSRVPSGTKDVAEIIEYGEGYTWKSSRIAKNPFPRPFHEEAFNELEKTGRHVKALKDGLNRQGIRVVD